MHLAHLSDSLYTAIGMARIAKLIPTIHDPLQSPVKGQLLGHMLPGLHLITLVSVLDEALCEYIEIHNLPWPSEKRRDLCNRLDVVSTFVPCLNTSRLHQIRKIRNSIAHSSCISRDQAITWTMLDEAIENIAEGFVAMRIIESSPSIIAFYERKPTVFPDELGPSGERMRHVHLVGAKVNGEVFLEYSSEIVYFPPKIS